MLINSNFTATRPGTAHKPGGPLFSGEGRRERITALEKQCQAAGLSDDQLSQLKNDSHSQRPVSQGLQTYENALKVVLLEKQCQAVGFSDEQLIKLEERSRPNHSSNRSQYTQKLKNFEAALLMGLAFKRQGIDISSPSIIDRIIKAVNAPPESLKKVKDPSAASVSGSGDHFVKQDSPPVDQDNVNNPYPDKPPTPPVSGAFLRQHSWHLAFEKP
jgi:hypothetical protein